MKFLKRGVTLDDAYEKLDDIEERLDEIEERLEFEPSMRERRLEEMFFNAKAHKIVEYENQIKNLKTQLECKDEVINQQQKKIEKLQKETEKFKEVKKRSEK